MHIHSDSVLQAAEGFGGEVSLGNVGCPGRPVPTQQISQRQEMKWYEGAGDVGPRPFSSDGYKGRRCVGSPSRNSLSQGVGLARSKHLKFLSGGH